MFKNLILKQFLKSLLTIMKGASQWLIVLVAGVALGLSAAFGLTEENFVADFAQSVLAIACETNE